MIPTKTYLLALLAIPFALPSCEAPLSAAQAERDRPSNMITDAQHRQRTVQRQDTIDEVHTRRHIRADQRDSVTHPIDTVGDALGGLNRVRWLGESLTR